MRAQAAMVVCAALALAGCAQQVADAVKSLPADPGTGRGWDTDPSGYEGNFNPCATLSTALVWIQGSTGSSPVTALMFHKGTYVGTATPKPRGFVEFDAAKTTDDTVVLDFKVPGACNACTPQSVTSVRYQWQDGHLVTLDPPPPPLP